MLGSPRVFFVECRHVAGAAHLDHLSQLSAPRADQSLLRWRGNWRREATGLATVAEPQRDYVPCANHFAPSNLHAPTNHSSSGAYDICSSSTRPATTTIATTATTTATAASHRSAVRDLQRGQGAWPGPLLPRPGSRVRLVSRPGQRRHRLRVKDLEKRPLRTPLGGGTVLLVRPSDTGTNTLAGGQDSVTGSR